MASERGEIHLRLGSAIPSGGELGDAGETPEDDLSLLAAGYASLTPLLGVHRGRRAGGPRPRPGRAGAGPAAYGALTRKDAVARHPGPGETNCTTGGSCTPVTRPTTVPGLVQQR